MRITEAGGGMEYVHPHHAHTTIRIMAGKPYSPFPGQQTPYAVLKIEREKVLDIFLHIVWTMSNKNYQRRVWIGGIGPECDSYDDAVNEFSSTCDAILGEYKNFGITDTQLGTLIQFRNVVFAFPKKYDLPQSFIDSPEWDKITGMAQKVLKAFGYKSVSGEAVSESNGYETFSNQEF